MSSIKKGPILFHEYDLRAAGTEFSGDSGVRLFVPNQLGARRHYDIQHFHICDSVYVHSKENDILVCDANMNAIKNHALNLEYAFNIHQSRRKSNSRYLRNRCKLDHDRFAPDRAKEACLVVPGWAPSHWGHFVCEYFLRFLACRHYLNHIQNIPLYISDQTTTKIREAIDEIFHDTDVEIRNFRNGHTTFFERAIIPSMPHHAEQKLKHHGYHPLYRGLIEDWIRSLKATRRHEKAMERDSIFTSGPLGDSDKIYLSRQFGDNYKQTTNPRPILNELEIIKCLSKRGFSIVSPESLSFYETIILLSRASVIVGGFGSALHNSLFSSIPATIISIGFACNPTQREIALLKGQVFIECPTFEPYGMDMISDILGREQRANLDLINDLLNGNSSQNS